MNNKNLPAVLIVIITLNEEKAIGKCLHAINKLDYPKRLMEVIVVDSNSIDKTREIAEKQGARVVTQNKKGFAAPRNVALKTAKKEVVVFTDADCVVSKGWLKELVKPLSKKIGVVTGACYPTKTNKFGYTVSALGYPAGGIGRALQKPSLTKDVSTCNVAFYKDLTKDIFFDESFIFGNEDADFFRKLSHKTKMFFNPKAVLYHKPKDNLTDFIKWWVRRGRADVHYHKKYLRAYPRSLFSPKISRLVHSFLILVVFIIETLFLRYLIMPTLVFLVSFIILRIILMQKRFGKIKKVLELPSYYYFTLIPLLIFFKDIFRDVGRLIQLINQI